MRCFYHNEIEAVGTCSKCGKAACRRCIEDVGGALLCNNCMQLVRAESAQQAIEEAAPFKKAIRRSWKIAGAAFAISLLPVLDKAGQMSIGEIVLTPIVMAYFFWSWYWGYRALSSIQPKIFLWMPLFGWVLYFTIKSSIGFTYGFLGGSIYEYLKTRRLVAAAEEENRILSEPQEERAKARSTAA